MQEANFFTALLLFITGLFLLGWFLYALLTPFFGTKIGKVFLLPLNLFGSVFTVINDFKGFKERGRFRKVDKNLKLIEENLDAGKIIAAKKYLQDAVFIDSIINSPQLIAEVTHHHNKLLNLLITIADKENITVQNLPSLENLFDQHNLIIRTIYETHIAKIRFSKKREEKGKAAPSWSVAEFNNKLKSLNSDLKLSSKKLLEELKLALTGKSKADKSVEQQNLH